MTSEAEAAALGHANFWDERYAKADDGEKPTHEWFRDFASLEPFFSRHLFAVRDPTTRPRIMHLGSGDSTIPTDLLNRGYDNQICIDFSTVVVELMRTRHKDLSIEWVLGDVRDMPAIAAKSVDVAFDKGTLDAMIHGSPWSPPSEVLDNTGKYMKEVLRVLKSDGFFLYITYRQPHFVRPILNRSDEWKLELEVLGGGDSFEYFGFVLRKQSTENTTAVSAA